MTGRTTPTSAVEHGLSVLASGHLDAPLTQDEHEMPFDSEWLAREMEEAANLCDQLEAQGRRIAFEPRGNGERGVQACIRDLITGDAIRELDTRDLLDVDRLIQLNGMGG